MAFREALELAGITNIDGRIGNPIHAGYVAIPGRIELTADVDAVEWSATGGRSVRPPENLIDKFARLHDAKPEKILAFARKYGVLGLRDDGIHFPEEWDRTASGLEPLVEWRAFALRVRFVLQLAAIKANKQRIPITDPPLTPVFENGLPHSRHTRGGGFLPRPTAALTSKIRYRVLEDGMTTPARTANSPSDNVLLGTVYSFLDIFPTSLLTDLATGKILLDYRRGLLSVIALQLFQAVNRKAVHICSECSNPFLRLGGSNMERRPKTNHDRFCDQCGRAAALRRADTRRREKERQAKVLYTAGESIKEIASRLGIRKAATVTGWVK